MSTHKISLSLKFLIRNMLKSILVFCVCFLFAANAFAAVKIEHDKFQTINLPGRGINTRMDHNHFQSKGINTLINVDGKLYMVSLNQSNEIIIDLVNDTTLEELYNTGLTSRIYNTYRGVGSVCSDGTEHLYISYFANNGTVSTAKVSLRTKSIVSDSSYRVLEVDYFPLDSVY